MSTGTRCLSGEDHLELLRLQVEALGGRMLGGYAAPLPYTARHAA